MVEGVIVGGLVGCADGERDGLVDGFSTDEKRNMIKKKYNTQIKSYWLDFSLVYLTGAMYIHLMLAHVMVKLQVRPLVHQLVHLF